jgi:DNA-binding MarR family transcriptional regulator
VLTTDDVVGELTPAGRAMADQVVSARREELCAALADEHAERRPEVAELLRSLARELAGDPPR